jgi:aldehyde dehydrogenase (NAD+)
LVACTFRTPAEAIELANNTRYGLAASVWSENINLALDIAPKLAAGVVWINGTNMFDAAAGFGGVRESGFGREGGWEGLSAYTKPKGTPKTLKPTKVIEGTGPAETEIDRTAKLYIGGKQARPDGGYSKPVWSPNGKLLGHASIANRKDVRNAVEAANAARGWSKTTGHLRAQILYYLAENLADRRTEFAKRLDDMTGKTGGKDEVEACLDHLFAAAAWADKYDGQVHTVPLRGVAMAMKEPVGTIGVFASDDAPLLSLIGAAAPAIAMGNSVIVVPSDAFPLAATDFYQVLDTSDVPGGVVNILTGAHADLAKTLGDHMDVDAVWSFSNTDLSLEIERRAAANLKRTWVNYGKAREWSVPAMKEVLEAATEVKNIWVPYGE